MSHMSQQNERFTELMNACRHHYRVVSVIVNGCGDAFIMRYWPYLQQLVVLGRIKLTIVDKAPLPQLTEEKLALASQSGEEESVRQLKDRYDTLARLLRDRPHDIRYLNNRSNPEDQSWYQQLTADIVFVLVPDNAHIEYAKDWLGRAILVIIEKPYSDNLVTAQKFEETLKEIVQIRGDHHPYTVVICVDHYLAKIHLLVANKDNQELQKQLGVIRRIEFSICEAGAVEQWRASSLQAGMTYDLFCHVLAMISPFVDLTSFPDAKGPGMLVAQHVDCPIDNESYGRLRDRPLRDFVKRQVILDGRLGKGVGQEDVKYLRMIGETGNLIYADLNPKSNGQISLQINGSLNSVFNVGKGHPEMLAAIFEGRFQEDTVGGLDGQTAVEILKIMTSIQQGIGGVKNQMKNNQYPIGAPLNNIDANAIAL